MTIKEYVEKNIPLTVRHNTEDEGNLIGLPYPYTVPCVSEKFNEMYYWDTYFTNRGLIADGNMEMAKNNLQNMFFMIKKYGFMPNGNRTYYLNRSQPPFLCLGVHDVYEATGDKEWLREAYDVLVIEYEYWMTKRLLPIGLNHYGTEENMTELRMKYILPDAAKRMGITEPITDFDEQFNICCTLITFCESGWDCNSRFDRDGIYYAPVELNALLYGFEKKMSEYCGVLELPDGDLWLSRAEKRKELMDKYLFDEKRGIYLDYNSKTGKLSPVVSIASAFPMFFGMRINKETVELIKAHLLKYGVSCSLPENTKARQWDYPNVWAPLQYIAYGAAVKAGETELAEKIRKTYIGLIEMNFEKTENFWEKYNGNTGEIASNEYEAPKMMGWTYGVYTYFKSLE